MQAIEFAALAAVALPKICIPKLDKTYWYTNNAYYPPNNMPVVSSAEQIALAHKLQKAATSYNRDLKLRYYCSKPTNKLMMNYLVFTSNCIGHPVNVKDIMSCWNKLDMPKNWVLLKSGPALEVSDVICTNLSANSVFFMEYAGVGAVKMSQSFDSIHTNNLVKNGPISRNASELSVVHLTLYVNSELSSLDIVDYVYQWLCAKIGEANTHKYNKLTAVNTSKTTKNVLASIDRYVTPTTAKNCFICKLTSEQLPVDYTVLNDINDDWIGNNWICIGCERACLLWEELTERHKPRVIPRSVSSNSVWLQLQQIPRIIEMEKISPVNSV